jgi:hypothetical protein
MPAKKSLSRNAMHYPGRGLLVLLSKPSITRRAACKGGIDLYHSSYSGGTFNLRAPDSCDPLGTLRNSFPNHRPSILIF